MTLAELRSATRYLCKEIETDSGTLFPSDNVLLDLFLNWACEHVVINLVEFLPETFLTYEDINLVATVSAYTLTAEWLQIWTLQKNVTGETPAPIPYRDVKMIALQGNVAETAASPKCWYFKGTSICFWPIPSTNKTAYARVWIIVPEAAAIVSGGPAIIPRMAHKLIPIQACILAGTMNEVDTSGLEKLYARLLSEVRGILGVRIQQLPRFLKEKKKSARAISERTETTT